MGVALVWASCAAPPAPPPARAPQPTQARSAAVAPPEAAIRLRAELNQRFAGRIARVESALGAAPAVASDSTTSAASAFLSGMHRKIHKLWGFGMLEEWDGLSPRNRYNDKSLVTELEIVLNPDGTVERVVRVSASGYLPYDAAAVDVVYSAGPYPSPAPELLSGNGKVYVHWRFYRDNRQCATLGAGLYVLHNGQSSSPSRDGGADLSSDR